MILSRALYSFLGLILGLVLYMVFVQENEVWRWGILPVAVLGFLTYIFSSEINHYWLNRFPLELDAREHQFLTRNFPYYAGLPPSNQKDFGKACIAFHRQRDFILQGMPNFPDDLKVLLAAQAVFLSHIFDLPLDTWREFDKVVLYPHPFMSPDIEEVHASETHLSEGVWLFSIDQLIPGMTQPHRFFNTGLYEFIRTIKAINPEQFAKNHQPNAAALKKHAKSFTKIDYQNIYYWLNIKDPDQEAIYLTLLLTHYSIWSTTRADKTSSMPFVDRVRQKFKTPYVQMSG